MGPELVHGEQQQKTAPPRRAASQQLQRQCRTGRTPSHPVQQGKHSRTSGGDHDQMQSKDSQMSS